MCSGHGSFSNDPNLNSVVGHILHSSILVPYHGWLVLDYLSESCLVKLFFFVALTFYDNINYSLISCCY